MDLVGNSREGWLKGKTQKRVEVLKMDFFTI
jgi:hypothetical protein